MEWYAKVINQYTDFKGRARRKEYWMFILINAIFVLLISLTEVLIRGKSIFDAGISGITLALLLFYGLFTLLPSIAVSIRRLHDSGRSGWWYLITVIPYVGIFVFVYFMVLDSEPDENKYGPNPKEIVH